jgi:hypothetical protein
MKIGVVTFLFFFYCFTSSAQTVSIGADQNNILYVGLDNPLTVAVENTSNKAIIVKTDNGTITGNGGKYMFRSTNIGRADIIIYQKIKGQIKEIGRGTFRIQAIPAPVPHVGPSSGGYIKGEILIHQQYIRADYECCGFDAKAPIDSFTICILRAGTCLYKEIKNIGSKFNDEIINALAGIKKDDTVIFKGIFARGPDNKTIPLAPILFFVTD